MCLARSLDRSGFHVDVLMLDIVFDVWLKDNKKAVSIFSGIFLSTQFSDNETRTDEAMIALS